MSKKNDPIEDARKRQAEIVAEQEEAQSVPPTPTQEEADRAKLGEKSKSVKTEVSDEKAEEADKAGTYKTRASKAD